MKSMISDFLNFFGEQDNTVYSDNLYKDFITQLGGRTFGNGLFNTFLNDDIEKWENIVSEAFPSFEGCFKLFGYDWLGRCFGIDLRKKSYGKVLLFEIGTDEILGIPCTFEVFLNDEIPYQTEACLGKSFFDEWMKIFGKELKYGRCAGYKIPLFLGGEDTVENLEDSDMEVYWSVITQVK